MAYTRLLHPGSLCWAHVGAKEDEAGKTALEMQECELEVSGIVVLLDELSKYSYIRSALPKLGRLAIGSIYGRQSDVGHQYLHHLDAVGRNSGVFTKCSEDLEAIISTSALTHVCLRGNAGPLSLRPMSSPATRRASHPSGGSTAPSVVCHFMPDMDPLCVRLGQPVRWVADGPASQNWYFFYQKMCSTFGSVPSLLGVYCPRQPKKDTVQAMIYGSTSRLGQAGHWLA